MPPFVMVSNRLPFTLVRGPDRLEWHGSTGGVVSSLEALIRVAGGAWIGWPGLELEAGEVIPDLPDDGYRVVPFHLDKVETDRYYDGFANRLLWPLFHGMPERAVFDAADWQSYQAVNRRFASAAAAAAGTGALVWLHDYHLLLAPAFIKERFPDRQVAFFLHIPFPSAEVFGLCPWHLDLLHGLLGADQLGLHVQDYVDNLFDCAERLPGAQVLRNEGMVVYRGHATRVGAFPIGADVERFDRWARDCQAPHEPGRVVLAVDRVDYTKGYAQRLDIYAGLLGRYPEHRGRILLRQIAVPSRPHLAEYRTLRLEIEGRVRALNEAYGTAAWSPIDYRYGRLTQQELACHYRHAAVCLVTPLSDGMNLVAKEFVACQADGDGVLVLSRFAGAARSMAEALIVDPRNVASAVEALHRALCMPAEERRERMLALRRHVAANDIQRWARCFLAAAADRATAGGVHETIS